MIRSILLSGLLVTSFLCAPAQAADRKQPTIAEAQSPPSGVTSTSPLPYPKMGLTLRKPLIGDKLGVEGAYVEQVEPERRGVKAGDVITQVNHRPVRTPRDVSDEIATVYRRGGKSVDVNVFVSRNVEREVRLFFPRDLSASNPSLEVKKPRQTEAQSPPSEVTSPSPLPYPKMGMTLRKPLIGDKLGVEGAYVEQVEPRSEAERRGVKVGDVITEVNHRPVRTPRDVSDEFAAVYRQGNKSVDVNVFVSRNVEREVRLFFGRDLSASNPSVANSATAGAVSALSWKGYQIGTEVAYGELTATQLEQMIKRTPGADLLAAETSETAAKVVYTVGKATIAKTPARWGLFFLAIGSGLYATYQYATHQFWHDDTQGNAKEAKSADVTRVSELGGTSVPDLGKKQGVRSY